MTSEEMSMNGYVPISTAAAQSGYSYSYVQQLAKRGNVPTKVFYDRILVSLEAVKQRREKMRALGSAKFIPHRYRPTEEAADAN